MAPTRTCHPTCPCQNLAPGQPRPKVLLHLPSAGRLVFPARVVKAAAESRRREYAANERMIRYLQRCVAREERVREGRRREEQGRNEGERGVKVEVKREVKQERADDGKVVKQETVDEPRPIKQEYYAYDGTPIKQEEM